MDIQQLKYAVEVERCGSISRAAEALFVSQPFLSKAVRELEGELGLELFNRSPRGVSPTKRGAVFLAEAKELISAMEELENSFSPRRRKGYEFELCVPIACYISHAFVRFVKALDAGAGLHADYRETNSLSTIAHVENHDCNIGIIRYPISSDGYFRRSLAELRHSGANEHTEKKCRYEIADKHRRKSREVAGLMALDYVTDSACV